MPEKKSRKIIPCGHCECCVAHKMAEYKKSLTDVADAITVTAKE